MAMREVERARAPRRTLRYDIDQKEPRSDFLLDFVSLTHPWTHPVSNRRTTQNLYSNQDSDLKNNNRMFQRLGIIPCFHPVTFKLLTGTNLKHIYLHGGIGPSFVGYPLVLGSTHIVL